MSGWQCLSSRASGRALSRGDGYLAYLEGMHGVSIGGIARYRGHCAVIAVEGKGGQSRIRTYIEGGGPGRPACPRLEGNDPGTPECGLGIFIIVGGVKRGDQAPLMGEVTLDFWRTPSLKARS